MTDVTTAVDQHVRGLHAAAALCEAAQVAPGATTVDLSGTVTLNIVARTDDTAIHTVRRISALMDLDSRRFEPNPDTSSPARRLYVARGHYLARRIVVSARVFRGAE